MKARHFMIIYKIENKINGKIYIGQTKRTLKERISEHIRKKTCVGNAIIKYGIENFAIDVLEERKTLDEINEREMFWIAYYHCKVPNGYNMTDGGDGVCGCHHTEETKLKLSKIKKNLYSEQKEREKTSAAMIKRYENPEEHKKQSECQKGRKHSEETRLKLSIAQKKRWQKWHEQNNK